MAPEMATAQTRPDAALRPPLLRARSLAARLGWEAPAALALALGIAATYAAFASGATGLPEESRLQVAIAAISVTAVAGLMFGRRLQAAASPAAYAGLGLLGLFAAWCGLSLVWSISPESSWIEANRAIAYALFAGMALVVGASLERAAQRVALGYLLLATAVALYALGGKALPWLELGRLLDFGDSQSIARLREPIGYWNALALLLVMAVPIAVRAAADVAASARARLLALMALVPLLTAVVLALSRGAIIVLLAALAVQLALSADRRRLLAVAGAGLVASVPAIVLGLSLADLTTDGLGEAERADDGLLLLAALIAGVLAAAALARQILDADERLAAGLGRAELGRRLGVAACVLALAGLLGGAAVSEGDLAGLLSQQVGDVTETSFDPQSDPARLLRTNSGNRFTWWKEAVGAAWDRPVVGHGAGSFAVLHRLYRSDQLVVRDAHSVPLEFLSETGLIGAALGLGGLGLLGFAAATGVAARPQPRERGYAVALLAASAAWGLHLFVDWDWAIPAVTLPALAFLGVLAAQPRGAKARPRGWRARPSLSAGPLGYGLGLAACVVALALVAASATLPALAHDRTEEALDAAARGGPAALEEAARKAEDAERLNPFALRPLFVGATIAYQRGEYADAGRLLLEAAEREPDNPVVWVRLGSLQALLRDAPGVFQSAVTAFSLDLYDPAPWIMLRRLGPPNERNSATVTGTPLPKRLPRPPAPAPAPVAPPPVAPGPVTPTVPPTGAPPPTPVQPPAPAPAPPAQPPAQPFRLDG